MKYNRKSKQTIEAVLWNGNQIENAPDWIGKALRNFDFDNPGWLVRENRPEGNIITIGTARGGEIAEAGDFICCNLDTGYIFPLTKEQLEENYIPEAKSGMTKNLESFNKVEQKKELTMFEKFQILNEGDTKNQTAHLAISNALVSANKVKAGGHVTVGVAEESLMKIVMDQENQIVLLFVIDRKAFNSIPEQ